MVAVGGFTEQRSRTRRCRRGRRRRRRDRPRCRLRCLGQRHDLCRSRGRVPAAWARSRRARGSGRSRRWGRRGGLNLGHRARCRRRRRRWRGRLLHRCGRCHLDRRGLGLPTQQAQQADQQRGRGQTGRNPPPFGVLGGLSGAAGVDKVGLVTDVVPSAVGVAPNPGILAGQRGRNGHQAGGLGPLDLSALRADELAGLHAVDDRRVGAGVTERPGHTTGLPPRLEHPALDYRGAPLRRPVDRRTLGGGEIVETADSVAGVASRRSSGNPNRCPDRRGPCSGRGWRRTSRARRCPSSSRSCRPGIRGSRHRGLPRPRRSARRAGSPHRRMWCIDVDGVHGIG